MSFELRKRKNKKGKKDNKRKNNKKGMKVIYLSGVIYFALIFLAGNSH